jgi:hypothetical protein
MGHHFAVLVWLVEAMQLPLVKQFSGPGLPQAVGWLTATDAAASVSSCSSLWSVTDCSFSDLPGHIVGDCGRRGAVEGQRGRQCQPGGRF